MKRRSLAGFTLVELMVVAAIVAILSAVAIPLMALSKKRAMATEAETGLGNVRSALRAMYAETRSYTVDPNGDRVEAGPVTAVPGIGANDLDGTFFRTSDYTIEDIDTLAYTLKCEGSSGQVQGVTIRLDHRGVFNRTGI